MSGERSINGFLIRLSQGGALAFVLFGFPRIVAHRFCLMGKTKALNFFTVESLCKSHILGSTPELVET